MVTALSNEVVAAAPFDKRLKAHESCQNAIDILLNISYNQETFTIDSGSFAKRKLYRLHIPL
jgi:hypothetical protein